MNRSGSLALSGVVFLGILLTTQLGGAEMFKYSESETHSARVWIDVNQKSPYVVEKNLFGKFTENLGHNIYHGFWAQLLENPSLEPVKECRKPGHYSGGELKFLSELAGENGILPGDEQRIGYYWVRWNGSFG